MRKTKYIGNEAEDAVIRRMAAQGYHFLVRNFTVHNMGELDVVMTKDNDLYIVEVKSRLEGTLYADPAASITFKKRKKMLNTSKVLINKYKLYDYNVHFLAGCVTHRRDGLIQNVEIIPF
ncbi:MAG: YraN family protein [Clostridiales bacterium]|nr:YraN family protein [Clostridiales bacterium]